MRQNKNRHTIFLKFMLSYVVVLLIPLLIGIFAYSESFNMIAEDAHESNLSMLEQSKITIDGRLAEVNAMIDQLALSATVDSMLSMANPLVDGSTVFNIIDMQSDLVSYKATNEFIYSFYIYSNKGDIVFSPETSYIRIPYFYDQIFKYGDMTFSEWKEQILDKNHQKTYLPTTPIYMNGYNLDAVTCIQSVPIGSYTSKGTIIVFIDQNKIKEYLNVFKIDEGGYAYILDKDGNMITSTSSEGDGILKLDIDLINDKGFIEYDLNGKKMIVSYIISKDSGWSFIAVLPSSVVLSNVDYMKRIVWIVVIASVLAGIITALMLAYWNIKPLRELLTIFKDRSSVENKGRKNEYDFIKGSISSLIESNTTLQDKVKQQLPLMKMTFFERLLNHKFIDSDEFDSFKTQIGLDVNSGEYITVIAQISGYINNKDNYNLQQLSTAKILLKEILERIIDDTIFTYDTDFDKIAIIIIYNPSEDSNYRRYIEQIVNEAESLFMEYYGENVLFAVGRKVKNFIDVSYSYNEIKLTLDSVNINKDNYILWYDSLPAKINSYYYPVDIELQLVNVVKSGVIDRAEEILNQIYTENFTNRKLSSSMIKQLIYNMFGTIYNIFDNMIIDNSKTIIEIETILEDLDNHINFDEIYESLINIYTEISDEINDMKMSRRLLLKESIIKYIQDYYMDAGLCLSRIAEYFSLTESYLSSLIKDQTGYSYSKYLENLRLENACILLNNADISINDIAKRLGYNSAHAFRRAFKRKFAVNPIDYVNDM